MSMRETIVGQFKKPHGYFGRIAGWIMANRRSNRERNYWTVDLLDIQPGDRVFEIGCGPGIALEACLARTGNGHVVGLDYSQTMLDQARTRNAEANREGRLDLQLGSFEDMPITGGSFNKICSANVVQFFPDRAAAFHKIFSILKPKGVVATTYMPRSRNPNRSDALKMADAVTRNMETAGFTNIRTEELPMNPAQAVCIIGEHP